MTRENIDFFFENIDFRPTHNDTKMSMVHPSNFHFFNTDECSYAGKT